VQVKLSPFGAAFAGSAHTCAGPAHGSYGSRQSWQTWKPRATERPGLTCFVFTCCRRPLPVILWF